MTPDTDFGDLRRVIPISQDFGFDRGQPVDRYYIERFLAAHSDDIRGRTLEIGDASYTRQYGGGRVTRSDVLSVLAGNPNATIVADLYRTNAIESDQFDCIIFTQTLQMFYDTEGILRTLRRILKPSGVLLATFPGISQLSRDVWRESWHWCFTSCAAGELFGRAFGSENVSLKARGNVLAATAFLFGIAAQELRPEELDHDDPEYEMIIGVRAQKKP